MLPTLFVWSPPDLFVVRRCTGCRRADVRVRWPALLDCCERCGAYVFTQPKRADEGGEEGDDPS
jgi:hypothetical protein